MLHKLIPFLLIISFTFTVLNCNETSANSVPVPTFLKVAIRVDKSKSAPLSKLNIKLESLKMLVNHIIENTGELNLSLITDYKGTVPELRFRVDKQLSNSGNPLKQAELDEENQQMIIETKLKAQQFLDKAKRLIKTPSKYNETHLIQTCNSSDVFFSEPNPKNQQIFNILILVSDCQHSIYVRKGGKKIEVTDFKYKFQTVPDYIFIVNGRGNKGSLSNFKPKPVIFSSFERCIGFVVSMNRREK